MLATATKESSIPARRALNMAEMGQQVGPRKRPRCVATASEMVLFDEAGEPITAPKRQAERLGMGRSTTVGARCGTGVDASSTAQLPSVHVDVSRECWFWQDGERRVGGDKRKLHRYEGLVFIISHLSSSGGAPASSGFT